MNVTYVICQFPIKLQNFCGEFHFRYHLLFFWPTLGNFYKMRLQTSLIYFCAFYNFIIRKYLLVDNHRVYNPAMI